MQVYLLKVKHVSDEEFEDAGVFTSEARMENGKKTYLKTRMKDGFKADEFRFTHSVFRLDKLQ